MAARKKRKKTVAKKRAKKRVVKKRPQRKRAPARKKVAKKKTKKKAAKKRTQKKVVRRNPAPAGYVVAANVGGKVGFYTGHALDTVRSQAARLPSKKAAMSLAKSLGKRRGVRAIGVFRSSENGSNITNSLIKKR